MIVWSSEYAKVLNVSGVQICYSYKGFWIKYIIVYIQQGSEYFTVSKYIKGLDILEFWICQSSLRKRYIICAWQDSEYSSSYKYGRVLNMPGFLKVLKKMIHYIHLYIYIFDRALNMPLVLKFQGYRKLMFLCKRYFRDSRYFEYPSGSQYTKIWNVSRILIC